MFVSPRVCGVARHWQSARSKDITWPLFRVVGLWFKGKWLSYQFAVTTGTSSGKGVVLQAAIRSFPFEELGNWKEITPCLYLLPCCCMVV